MHQDRDGPSFRAASEVFNIVHVTGTPYEMGYQHGVCLRQEIAHGVYHGVQRFALSQQGWPRDALFAFARQVARTLPPAYSEELRGLSAGSGVPLDDLVLWNFFDDYWEVCGCSAFAASGVLTASGTMLVGHNIDYPENGSHAVAVTVVRVPSHGWPSLCQTWAGIVGTYEGMNGQGLVIANQFSETDDTDLGGVPIKVVNRLILDHCARPAEAVALVRSLRRNFGSNILVADREQALVMECSGREVVVRHGRDGAVAVSNHYCALVPRRPQHTTSSKTRERLAALEHWLTTAPRPVDVPQCIARLDTPPMRRDGPPDNWTLSSAVYTPETLTAHLAHGWLPASRGRFVEVCLPTLLAGPGGLYCSPYGARVAQTGRPSG